MRRTMMALAAVGVLVACGRAEPRMDSFSITELPASRPALDWILLAFDDQGDGRDPASADGRAFYYYYEAENDNLWFRFELYGDTLPTLPAVSVAFDTDMDQDSGVS